MDQQAPLAPWLFEVVGPLIFLVMCGYYVRQCRRAGRLTIPALVFIGAFTMWWQEWYGDWGGYVLYNPHLHLIPGYDLPFTSPNKPWAVIPAYGWFYGLVYFPVISIVTKLHGLLERRSAAGGAPQHGPAGAPAAPSPAGQGGLATAVRRVTPSTAARTTPKMWMLLLAVGLPTYYLWDLLIEGVASVWGMWSYTHYTGPTIVTSRGNFPLVYPIVPFALMMALTLVVINAKRPDGTPTVEAWARVNRWIGGARTTARIVTWIVTMNACYWFFFIFPQAVVRELWLPGSLLVP